MVCGRTSELPNSAHCLRFNIDPPVDVFARKGYACACSTTQSPAAHINIGIHHWIWIAPAASWRLARSYTVTC